jgi:serine/threonine-protein phosphatase 2B catalytic subunit
MESLLDACGDRQFNDFPPPPHRPIFHTLLFPNSSNKPDWRLLRTHLAAEGRVSKPDLILLIELTISVFKSEPNLLSVSEPVTVVGDIHGQFYDLLTLLDIGGDPDDNKYLFLGDFVDRGNFAVEAVILLFAIKLNYPGTVLMLRGNHECR